MSDITKTKEEMHAALDRVLDQYVSDVTWSIGVGDARFYGDPTLMFRVDYSADMGPAHYLVMVVNYHPREKKE